MNWIERTEIDPLGLFGLLIETEKTAASRRRSFSVH